MAANREAARDRANAVMARCNELATASDEPGRLTRGYGTPASRQAQLMTATWMEAAGMTVRRDAVGNLIGRYPGDNDSGQTLLLGSHLDSVRDAGRYDGPLGVLVGLTAVERLHARSERLPFAIDVLAFADEEGLRYGTAYLGSTAYTGAFDRQWLTATDAQCVTLAEAVRDFDGDPDALGTERRDGGDLLGWVEVHIEQGPSLEAHDLPVGIVTAIAGRTRIDVTLTGEPGHAGTVAMPLRRDALGAAAELVLAVESMGREVDGLVATIGQLTVEPGAANVIPGLARLTMDIRHSSDDVRQAACRDLAETANRIAAARQIEIDWAIVNDNVATPCDPRLTRELASAVNEVGYATHLLPSGAGHDAVTLSAITPVAMLFVRCAGGISHNPAESVTEADVAVAIRVLDTLLTRLAANQKASGAENRAET